MEGDRILSVLKEDEGNWATLPRSVKCYLQPLFEKPNDLRQSARSKYELFSYKVLRQCVQYLHRSPQIMLEVTDLCCQAISLCPKRSKNIAPLTFERLLMQLSGQCLKVKAFDRCLSVCMQVANAEVTRAKPGLLKYVFQDMWKAAVQMEKLREVKKCNGWSLLWLLPPGSSESLSAVGCPQAQQVLAAGYLWKAMETTERLMMVSRPAEKEEEKEEEKSCDQSESAAAAAVCLFSEEEDLMMNDDITQWLSNAVGAWQEVWLAVEGMAGSLDLKELFYQPLDMLQQLLLTAFMCAAYSQTQLALKCLTVLLNLCAKYSPTQHIAELRGTALALFAQILSSEGGVAPLSSEGGMGPLSSEGGVAPSHIISGLEECIEKEEGEVVVASLHCSLALAELHLSQCKMDESRAAIQHMLDHPSLSGRNANSLFVMAKAKLLACRFLLHRTSDLKSSKSLLQGRKDQCETGFTLTPVELAVDSVKVLWDLLEHYKLKSGYVMVWSVLLSLLKALHTLGHLQYLHGDVKDALYYGREGAMLARTLHLKGWYQEFLLLLGKSYLLGGLLPSCSLVSSQLARLNPSRAAQRIQLACLTSHLAMAEDCESSEVESSLAEAANLLGKMENAKAIAFSIEAELAATRAKYLLAAHQTDRARSTISEALAKVSVVDEVRSHEDCTALAWLHHYMGVAIAQQLESLEGGVESLFSITQGQDASGLLSECVEEFMLCYQLCYPATPTNLLRQTCLWLGLLLQCPDHAHHFQALSQHTTLAHQTVASLGKKIRKKPRAAEEHVADIKSSLLDAIPPPGSAKSPSKHLLKARQLILPPSSAPSPCHTSNYISHIPPLWTVITITMAPKPHPSSPAHVIISKVTHTVPKRQRRRRKNDDPVVSVHVERLPAKVLETAVQQLREILAEEKKSQTLKSRKEWWGAKFVLDERLEKCLNDMKAAALVNEQKELWACEGPVLLVLGKHLLQLPWEALFKTVVVRTPSLGFAITHRTMVDKDSIHKDSTYFVINPGGDLKKTEKLFGGWFEGQAGWKGVVGRAPPPDEFSLALQEKDLYVYCGHGVGRFLKDSHLHALHCRASALLMGCSSAQLVVHGQCDPSGALLSYLLAGCPILVGCLWSVTDGEIDRFCQALVRSVLSDTDINYFSEHVEASRKACKLPSLVGAAPVVYGCPIQIHHVH